MLPKDKGGVVSPELKVYGTKNLRIADLSVVPLHVGANTQCTHPRSSASLLNTSLKLITCVLFHPLTATAYGLGEIGECLFVPCTAVR